MTAKCSTQDFMYLFSGRELLTDFCCSLMTAQKQRDTMFMESQKKPCSSDLFEVIYH